MSDEGKELEPWQRPALTSIGKPAPTEESQLTPEEYKRLARKAEFQEGDQ